MIPSFSLIYIYMARKGKADDMWRRPHEASCVYEFRRSAPLILEHEVKRHVTRVLILFTEVMSFLFCRLSFFDFFVHQPVHQLHYLFFFFRSDDEIRPFFSLELLFYYLDLVLDFFFDFLLEAVDLPLVLRLGVAREEFVEDALDDLLDVRREDQAVDCLPASFLLFFFEVLIVGEFFLDLLNDGFEFLERFHDRHLSDVVVSEEGSSCGFHFSDELSELLLAQRLDRPYISRRFGQIRHIIILRFFFPNKAALGILGRGSDRAHYGDRGGHGDFRSERIGDGGWGHDGYDLWPAVIRLREEYRSR